ncbi:MAG: flavodoxin [Firmicutes bacterium HGW-Firmicutes-12]|jgi:menaquinone-dependent protoporphyrinogen IX oxidase|nr:MAG: flavodoxin [Firmicutes bacterium HGW-Firmicutes-12]
MKTVIIYKSKSGFTKKYAEWIAEELSAEMFEASKVSADLLMAYDVVIYGAGLYAGGINGLNLITQNLDKLNDKRIVVFTTGASPSKEETITEIRNKNLTSEQQKHIQFFYLRGGFDYSKLKLVDRFLMKLLKKKLSKKEELTPDESGMLAAYDTAVDFTSKKNMDELISYVKS